MYLVRLAIRAMVFQVFLYPIASLFFLLLSEKLFYAIWSLNKLSVTVFCILYFISYLLAYDSSHLDEYNEKHNDGDTEGY